MRALIPISQTLGEMQVVNGCRNPIAVSIGSSPQEYYYKLGNLYPRQMMSFSFSGAQSYIIIDAEPHHDSFFSIRVHDRQYTKLDINGMYKHAVYNTVYNLRLT